MKYSAPKGGFVLVYSFICCYFCIRNTRLFVVPCVPVILLILVVGTTRGGPATGNSEAANIRYFNFLVTVTSVPLNLYEVYRPTSRIIALFLYTTSPLLRTCYPHVSQKCGWTENMIHSVSKQFNTSWKSTQIFYHVNSRYVIKMCFQLELINLVAISLGRDGFSKI